MSLTHAKVGTQPDGPDSSKVRTTDWNADHVFAGGALGSLLYRDTNQSGGSNWLADVATGNVLLSGGVAAAPAFGKVGLTTHVSGTLPSANGGTGFASFAVGDLLYADTTTSLAKRAAVAVGSVLVSGGVGAAPAWSASPVVTSLVLPNSATIAQTATAQFDFSGTYSPTGQGRGIYYAPTLNTEATGAMLAVGFYPTITVANGLVTTSINNLELRPTFTGTPSSLNYAVNLSVVDFVAPTNTIEACTVRIDNAPTGASRNWALFVGDGGNYFGGKRGHHFGNGTTDSSTQVLFRTTADTSASRGAWFDTNLAAMGNGDFGAIVLVDGTLKEPASGSASGAGVRINAPTITADGGAFTNLSSLYVSGAPTAATNNYSIFVDAGISRFDGQVQVAQGSASAPSIADQTAPTRGLNFGNNQIEFINGGNSKWLLDNTGAVLEMRIGSAAALSWSSNGNPTAAGGDTYLRRSAAGTIGASANGTTNGGTFDAAAYKVGGAAGIDFSGPVTSITVVKGIVTAAS